MLNGQEALAMIHADNTLRQHGVGPDTAQILTLRVVLGRSLQEVAGVTGISPASVRQMEDRAIREMRDETFDTLTALATFQNPSFDWHRSVTRARAARVA